MAVWIWPTVLPCADCRWHGFGELVRLGFRPRADQFTFSGFHTSVSAIHRCCRTRQSGPCELSAVARFVARSWPVKDPAGCAEFRGVGDGATVACPGMVTFPAFTWWAALRPARLIGAVPLGAVQRTHYGPAITVGHEVTDVGVGELVARGACHALVLRCGSDSRGSVVVPPHRHRIRPLHTYLDTPTYAPVIGVFYAP